MKSELLIVMMCILFFLQYIVMWIYTMPYWSLKFAFVQEQVLNQNFISNLASFEIV